MSKLCQQSILLLTIFTEKVYAKKKKNPEDAEVYVNSIPLAMRRIKMINAVIRSLLCT